MTTPLMILSKSGLKSEQLCLLGLWSLRPALLLLGSKIITLLQRTGMESHALYSMMAGLHTPCALHREGIYRHQCCGIFQWVGEAVQAAVKLIKDEPDHYIKYVVIGYDRDTIYPVDKEPEPCAIIRRTKTEITVQYPDKTEVIKI